MSDESVSISVDLSESQYSKLEELAENEDTDVSSLLVRGADMFIAAYSQKNGQTQAVSGQQEQIIEMLVLLLKMTAQILFYCTLRLKMGALPSSSMPNKGRLTVWEESRIFAEKYLTDPDKVEI